MVFKMMIGFLVNPIAGMGGRVGLKGTDNVLEEAIRRGAKPISPVRASRFLSELSKYKLEIEFVTPPSIMGEDFLMKTKFKFTVEGDINIPTTREDTINFVEKVKDSIDLLVFVGGDGTARDIYQVIDAEIPVIGVPSGVKIFSGVFTITPEDAAKLLHEYIKGEAILDYAEVLDIDEDEYRSGKIKIKVYGYMKIPYRPGYIQGSKSPTPVTEVKEELEAIARYIVEEMEDDVLYITCPGNTVKEIHKILGFEYTPLGVDLITKKSVVKLDASEKDVITYLKKFSRAVIIVSPIGGQGIIFGRGNQVVSPDVLRMVGLNNIIVLSPRWKLSGLECLYVDTDDASLNREFPEVIKVVVGYGEYRVMRICK